MKDCFECSNKAKHMHHVIPKVLGGTKMVPLCEVCHGIIHNISFTNHGVLIKKGLQKAKESGVKLGRKRTRDVAKIAQLLNEGLSQRQVANIVGCSKTTVMRESQEIEQKKAENTINEIKRLGY